MGGGSNFGVGGRRLRSSFRRLDVFELHFGRRFSQCISAMLLLLPLNAKRRTLGLACRRRAGGWVRRHYLGDAERKLWWRSS